MNEVAKKNNSSYYIVIIALLVLVGLFIIIAKFIKPNGNNSGATSAQKRSSAYADSLMAADTALFNSNNNAVPDSFIAKQQTIAFADLKFGMSKSEYNRSKSRYSAKIGDYTYVMSPKFNHEGKLYKLYIRGSYNDANYLNTDVEKQAFNLIKAITLKYGDGEKVSLDYPSILNINSGYITSIQTWTIGTKKINVGVGEVSDGAEFYASAIIENKDMASEQDDWELEKSTKNQKEDAGKF